MAISAIGAQPYAPRPEVTDGPPEGSPGVGRNNLDPRLLARRYPCGVAVFVHEATEQVGSVHPAIPAGSVGNGWLGRRLRLWSVNGSVRPVAFVMLLVSGADGSELTFVEDQ
jgi:hypothetical protein